MNEKINKLFKENPRKRLIMPIALLSLWLVLTLWYLISFDISFSNLSYNYNLSSFNSIKFSRLYKEDKISGEFHAQDNNLGIVSIRFQTYVKPPYKYEDNFLFRIKEKGASTWYYENTYKSGLIYDVPFFPFGFPQITNSKGKEYEFEITSLNGNSINAISVKNQFPILEAKYKYSGRDLIHDKTKLLRFSVQKTYNAFQVPDIWFSSLIYLLPFLFYFFWTTVLGNFFLNPITLILKKIHFKLNTYPIYNKLFYPLRFIFVFNFDLALIVFVLVDILLIQLTNDIVYLVIISLWMVTLNKYKLDSKQTFLIGILLLCFSPIFLFFNDQPTAEKASIWAYMFFVAGTIQILIEKRKVRIV